MLQAQPAAKKAEARSCVSSRKCVSQGNRSRGGESVVDAEVRDDLLHHLLLHVAGRLSALHHVAALVAVAHVAQAERTTAVLVAGELGDGRGRVILGGELNNAGAAGTHVGLHFDLRTLDLADRYEELDEVVVGGAPRQL